MKIILTFVLMISWWTVYSQKNQTSSLELTYPEHIRYKTIEVLSWGGKLLNAITTNSAKGKVQLTFNIDSDIFAIYFGGNSTGRNDTLYFMTGKEKIMSIELPDSFSLREPGLMKISGLYNFEVLYQEYRNWLDSAGSYFNSLVASGQKKSNEREDFLLTSEFDFVKSNRNNPYMPDLFSMIVLNRPFSSITYAIADSFYLSELEPYISASTTKDWVESKIAVLKNGPFEGNSCPSFATKTLDGKKMSKESLAGKNVLWVFWASWCQPCMKELPVLKQLGDDFEKKGLKIIGVSLDWDSTQMIKAMTRFKIEWPQVFNDKELLKTFRINPIPALIFVNADGKVVYNSYYRVSEPDDFSVLTSIIRKEIRARSLRN